MRLTFYRYNKITDALVEGKVVDLSFNQLVFNLKAPQIVGINLANLMELKEASTKESSNLYAQYKDSGFFIGGEVAVDTKSRKASSILNRTLLTFDIDIPKEDIWAKFKELFPGIQAIKYSTISSSADNPRYRILVPLDKPVGSSDYVKIMKQLIKELGEASFDATTSEASRVMFFPAVCQDQEFVFDTYEGGPLNSKEVLDRVKESFEDILKRDRALSSRTPAKEKKGVVGAFNRCFSISETIEKFLPGVYAKGFNSTVDSPRYLYHKSKGMPGARVYDNDTMIFSAHDTDPAKGKNLDAFNLVKLHLFENDFEACRKWANKIPEVQEEMMVNTELIDTSTEWVNVLYKDPKKGTVLNTPFNLQTIMLNDPQLKDMFRLNNLTYMIEVCRDLGDIGGTANRLFKTIEDSDIIEVQIYMETSSLNVRAGKQGIQDIVCQVARLNQYDPVKDYLEGLEDAWDGVPRIETMFSDYLMADDTPLNRAIARKVMAAAVWRVMKPGIKWEGVPVFHGVQGCGKSTFIQKLYKSSMYDHDCKNWVNNTPIDLSNIDKAIQRTKGFWGIELAELANTTMSNYSNEQMKAFISMDRPVTRIPYDKFEITIDRKCVFWGTTNVYLYISDQTGARRFLPIDCKAFSEEEKHECLIKVNNLPADQLWAEAMSFYREEKLYFTVEEEKQLKEIRARHTEESTFEAVLEKFTNAKITADWETKTPFERRVFFQETEVPSTAVIEKQYVSLSEIAYEALAKSTTDLNRKIVRDIELTLMNLGWEVAPYPVKTIYGQSKTFRRRNKKGGQQV